MPGLPVADVPAPASRNPPIDYAVAVWVGMPDDELARGIREGWIRAPQAIEPSSGSTAQTDAPRPFVDGEDDGDGEDDDDGDGVVDRARVQALLQRLDATLDQATFEAAWQEAGSDDVERLASFTRFLSRALGVSGGDGGDFAAIENAAQVADGSARLIRLAGRSGSELEALARTHAGVRRALAEQDAWSLSGDALLARVGDPSGRYDRFDRDSGEMLLSDAWVGDRARHAAWRMATAGGDAGSVEGDGWRFVDRNDAAATVELSGDGSAMHQVIFARDGGDSVEGGATTDRIHGGDGSDSLSGRAGEDLLEGGRGDDRLRGGSGRDDLAGGQGDDEIDGGAGADRIDGGSGDDDLTGGRGDDLLRGGAGRDVYRSDDGDGRDTIDDADGGEIVVDDIALEGTMQRDGDGWSSEDGRFVFSLDGAVEEGGTLSIRRTGAPAGDTITVAGWRQGAFGFLLEDGGDVDGEVADGAARQFDAGHPLSVDVFGNEGSTGIPLDVLGPADAAATDVAPDEPDIATVLADDALADPPLVDVAAVMRAFDAWKVAAPPDVDASGPVEAQAVTAADFADALAGHDAAADDAGSIVPLADTRVANAWMPLGEIVAPSPPALVLRHTS